MQFEPCAELFAARYAAGEPQGVWTTLVADLETPVSAFLKIAGSRASSFFFESVEDGAGRGRYSIVGLGTAGIFRITARRAAINRAAQAEPEGFAVLEDAPLTALRKLLAESHIALPDVLPPMAAGVFGYLGYDIVRLIEDLPPPRQDQIGIPDAVLIRPTLILIFDAVEDTITIVTPARRHEAVPAQAALAGAKERLLAGPR